jgi:hypothetical protein
MEEIKPKELIRIQRGLENEVSILYIKRYKVLRYTPKGCWISDLGIDRWVSLSSRKRFAYPTKEEAVKSYTLRKKRELIYKLDRIEKLETIITQIRSTLKTGIELKEIPKGSYVNIIN